MATTDGARFGAFSGRTAFGLALEGFVVIVSILIAFGLDAWWGERQLQQDLQDDLTDVARELRSNIAALNVELRFQRTAVTSVDDLLGRIDAASDAQWLTLPDTVASFAACGGVAARGRGGHR